MLIGTQVAQIDTLVTIEVSIWLVGLTFSVLRFHYDFLELI